MALLAAAGLVLLACEDPEDAPVRAPVADAGSSFGPGDMAGPSPLFDPPAAADAGDASAPGNDAGSAVEAAAGAPAVQAFTLAVLPDTQIYSISFPGIYLAQTSWIAANAANLNIAYVLHLGDITDRNTPLEWQRAAQAMWLLDGVVPYALGTGNHDFGPNGHPVDRQSFFNQYFPYAKTAAWPTFGGAFEPQKLDNTYHLFAAGGRKYIVIALEWGPRNQAVAWADAVMAAHPDRFGILVTHAYLNNNDRRYDMRDTAHPQDFNPHQYPTPDVNDGEELWQKLVRKHAFVMVMNGHVLGDGTGYLASVTDKGTTCHQMLSNYQFRNLGGEGYLRLVQVAADQQTVKVRTYSPLYDRELGEPDQSYTFRLNLPMSPR